MALPIRLNLVAQTVEILDAEISRGDLRGELPGEFALCERLQISRTTLRAALRLMELRGYFRMRAGRRRVILKRSAARRRPLRRHPVRLIAGRPLQWQTRHTNEVLSQVMLSLQRRCGECGYVSDLRFAEGSPDHLLNRMEEEAPEVLSVLVSCSAETQNWFYRRGKSAFVLGHLHTGVRLPAIDVDLHSVGRHAAAQLLSRGHRHIGLIFADPCSAGELSIEAGFAAALAQAGYPGSRLSTVKLRWERSAIIRWVEGSLLRPGAPSAVFTLSEETAICLYSFLIRRGVRVPQEMSIVVGDGGEMIERFWPDFARYKVDLDLEVKRTCQIVGNFATNRVVHPTSHLLMPDFHRGETIAAV